MADSLAPPPVPDAPVRARPAAPQPEPQAPVGGGVSDRIRLAWLARAVALQMPGVVATDGGPAGRYTTGSGAERLDGVLCVASPEGGYELTLSLVCGLVPLQPLGSSIRDAVTSAAAAAGLPLRSVNIHVAALAQTGGG